MKDTDIKELRKDAHLTQAKAAEYLGLPLRTYIRYEQKYPGASDIKVQYIVNKLSELTFVDEDHGVLSMDRIRENVSEVCEKYGIGFCYLFGSYAKGTATEKSDVDLLIDTSITGLHFFGLVDEFRNTLHKRVDLLRADDLTDNKELMIEIFRTGVRLYG